MTPKALLISICILFLAACQPDLETIEVTPRPTLTATALATNTAVPTATAQALSPTATSTAVPPTPFPTATIEPTTTPTPTAVLPSASVLFVRDNALQQWLPQTGEVKTLVENVTGVITYSTNKAVFQREITPEQEYALIVFHIPTQSEYELFRTSTTSMIAMFGISVSISPNGRWLAYMSGDSRDSVTLMVHEIMVENQQVSVSPPVLSVVPGNGWKWPYDQLTWPTENELSWSDRDGIWVADLTTNPIQPVVAIAPSTNTFLLPPLNPADSDKGPDTVFTKFIPFEWSPDGRYLLAEEHFFEYGELRIIERFTNHIVEIPESSIGPLSDAAIWLDNTTLLHYQNFGTVRIWQLDQENDPFLYLRKAIPVDISSEIRVLLPVSNNLRFYSDGSLFSLNLETGELIQLAQGVSWLPLWSPNGQHVLWSKTEHVNDEWLNHVFVDDLNGDAPVEMELVFGLDSCCRHWYEE